jgi:hypothetical protein
MIGSLLVLTLAAGDLEPAMPVFTVPLPTRAETTRPKVPRWPALFPAVVGMQVLTLGLGFLAAGEIGDAQLSSSAAWITFRHDEGLTNAGFALLSAGLAVALSGLVYWLAVADTSGD